MLPLEMWVEILRGVGLQGLLPQPLREGHLQRGLGEIATSCKLFAGAVRCIEKEPPHILVPSKHFKTVYAAVKGVQAYQAAGGEVPIEIRLKKGRHWIQRPFISAWYINYLALPLVGVRRLTFRSLGGACLWGTLYIEHSQDIRFEGISFLCTPDLEPEVNCIVNGASSWGGVQRVSFHRCTFQSPGDCLRAQGPVRLYLEGCLVEARRTGIGCDETHLLLKDTEVFGFAADISGGRVERL